MLTNTRRTRVEWCDCDPAGIIFYPRYFEIFDTSTTALFERALGMNKIAYLKHYNFAGYPMVSAQARFHLPTRFGDDIAIETKVAEYGRSSFKIEHRLMKGGDAGGGIVRDASVGDPGARHRAAEVASDPARSAGAFAGLTGASFARQRAPRDAKRLAGLRRGEPPLMRIDAYTHFFPKKFFDKLNEVAGDYKDMGKRVRSLPALYDIDVRKKIVDGHKDYQQILSYPQPTIEKFAKTPADIDEFCRIINDGFAELCAKEKDHFPGWVAQISLAAPDAGVAEAERAIKQLGALGVQIHTNVAGKPIDRPEFRPFWKKMNELGAPVWMHPTRGAETPDYIAKDRSLYEIWWTFGWSYETATAMARLVFAKIIDDFPNLKIITHHFGGIVPMLEGRLGARQRRAWLRARADDRLCHFAQEPEEARARLFQGRFLGRHRGIHRRSGHQGRDGILSARQNCIRFRLSVRPRGRDLVSAGNNADPR